MLIQIIRNVLIRFENSLSMSVTQHVIQKVINLEVSKIILNIELST